MLPLEVLRQVRRLQLKARRAVQTLLGGEYHSVFKGTGLSFEEVREYQPGDDVRTIDWNVTARMGTPYIKRYIEERELTVVLAVDLSGSLRFGTQRHLKRTVASEVAALLAFSAVANNDRVGLIAFTDEIERFLAPGKGARHALRVLRDILFLEPERRGTDLNAALDFLNSALPRRAVVFLLSDFLDGDFTRSFRLAARKHDLVAVRVHDEREMTLPPVGLIDFEDAESGRTTTIDTGSHRVREAYAKAAAERARAFTALAKSSRVDTIDVRTDGNHFDALLRFFRLREARQRRGG